jgi:tetratricopeptide (TPR) repeat protein
MITSQTSAHQDCPRIERDIEARMTLVASAADTDGSLHSLNVLAREALAQCPNSEPLLYIVARTAELGYGDGPRSNGPTPQARELASTAVGHHPGSVRLQTIFARLDGGVAAARRAYESGTNYAPARVTLALALAGENDFAAALKLLPKRAGTVAERIARARILLVAGRAPEAAHEAAAAGDAREEEVELMPGPDLERDRQEVWGLALVAQSRFRDAAPHLKLAAGLGSARAAAALKNLR